MIIDTERLILGYYDTIKTIYPDLSFEEVNLMCRSPFQYLKKMMQLPSLPQIRYKYFGVFLVKERRIANAERIAQHALQKGSITTAKYEKIQLIIQKNDESKG